MTLRRHRLEALEADEIDRVTHLVNRANERSRDLFPGPRLGPATLRDEYAACELLTLEGAEGYVGTVLFEPRGDALKVFLLAVTPEQQGRQLGAQLLEQVAQIARQQQLRRLLLEVTDQGGLVAYYLRAGFYEVRRDTCAPGHWGSTASFELVEMERILS